MKMDPAVKQQILKNALLSLVIYALPVMLMFATFYFTGQKPWLNKAKAPTVEYKMRSFNPFKK